MKDYDIVLSAVDESMRDEWAKQFRGCSNVSVVLKDIILTGTDAIVSPANSFGFMDGGLDMYINHFFGNRMQDKVQEIIRNKHNGELLVGLAEIINTDDCRIPYLVVAPTMRVPSRLEESINPYLATKAVFRAIGAFNSDAASSGKKMIKSVAIPAMGAGVGGVPYDIVAKQMRKAYNEAYLGIVSSPSDFSEAQHSQRDMI